jgi:hypothetical protein
VDSTNVYWTDLGTSSGNGAILQTPIAGGEIITLAFGQAQPIAIAVDEAQVFWIASDDVLAVPIGGGQLTTIATDPLHPAALVDDGTNLYWLDSGNGADGALIGWSPASGTATTLAAALSKSQALTFDTDTLYWATFASDGAIESLPKAGGAMAATLASGLGGILALAVDATSVYSTNHFDGTITRTPKTGGLPITLASGFTGLSGLAVDATDLYWTDTGTCDSRARSGDADFRRHRRRLPVLDQCGNDRLSGRHRGRYRSGRIDHATDEVGWRVTRALNGRESAKTPLLASPRFAAKNAARPERGMRPHSPPARSAERREESNYPGGSRRAEIERAGGE